jgi:hypothetical protein
LFIHRLVECGVLLAHSTTHDIYKVSKDRRDDAVS